jgi:hypothetical protein
MEDRDLITQMKGLSPRESSQIFDEKFEVSEGSGDRQTKGEQMYAEYTGKDPGKITSDNSSGATDKNCGRNVDTSAGAVPGETCAEALPAAEEAISSGKIVLAGGGDEQHDIENCSDEPIERCTEGIRGKTLRALVASANSAGTDSVTVTDIHRHYDCEYGDHPSGLALDLGAVNGEACDTNSQACDALFQYLIDNREELDIRWIIYNGPGCERAVAGNDGFSECRGDHSDHIHVSFNE